MILVLRAKTLIIMGLLIMIIAILGVCLIRPTGASVNKANYRIFVAGIGTVEGKWQGEIGVAVIGLETRPAAVEKEELKVIDILITNGRSEELHFNPDIALINPKGERFGLQAEGQQQVMIKPGAMSQGTVIINVPRGTPEMSWMMEIKGGPFKDGVIMPLRVQKVKE